jgi:hypothetical protein
MKLVDALMLFGSAILAAGVASIILFDISGFDTNMVRFDAIVAARDWAASFNLDVLSWCDSFEIRHIVF